jgi:hypothetical protein
MTRVGTALLGAVTVMLVVAGSALAEGPASSGYGGKGTSDIGTSTPSGGLPLTGLSLVLVVAAGALLVACGVFLRRRSSSGA